MHCVGRQNCRNVFIASLHDRVDRSPTGLNTHTHTHTLCCSLIANDATVATCNLSGPRTAASSICPRRLRCDRNLAETSDNLLHAGRSSAHCWLVRSVRFECIRCALLRAMIPPLMSLCHGLRVAETAERIKLVFRLETVGSILTQHTL